MSRGPRSSVRVGAGERKSGGAHARWARDEASPPVVTPVRSGTAPINPTHLPPELARRPSSSSTASSGETGLTGQPGSELEARDLAQSRVDLPVPVIRAVDLFPERGGVEDEVVRAARRARWRGAEHVAQRLGGGPDVGGASRATEVGVVAARHDPDLERRARGVRREGHAVGVLPDQPVRSARSPRGRDGRTGTPPRGSRTAPRRRAPPRSDAGSAAGRTGRGTGGSSARRPARPSSGRP